MNGLPNNDFFQGGLLLMIIGGTLAYLRYLPMRILRFCERYLVVRVELRDDDETYHWVKFWLSDKLTDVLSVNAQARRPKVRANVDYEYASGDLTEAFRYEASERTDRKPRVVFVPAVGTYFMTYKGKVVFISKSRAESGGGSDSSRAASFMKPREEMTVWIWSRNRDIALQMLEEARDFSLPDDGRIEVRTPSYDCWKIQARVRPRRLDSVITEGNQGEDILQDIQKFCKSEDWYSRLGIPYRRGYLLHGSPGSGKTSLIMAIASEMRMGIYIVSFASRDMSDENLNSLMSSVGTNSIVLMEDIDCAFVERKSEEETSRGVSFSGLLNCLDGIAAQEGRIVFMTTNHRDKLDPALIRPGRIDKQVELRDATPQQAYRIFDRFFPGEEGYASHFANHINFSVSMAAIQGHLENYKDDHRRAAETVHELEKK